MAASPWKSLFWERFSDGFDFAGSARGRLATVGRELAAPLRGGEEGSALARIRDCDRMLAEVAEYLAFVLSALGTVEVVALRCLSSVHVEEVRARVRALAAREQSSKAYDAVASSRGHLGAAGRLLAATGIPDDAAEEERAAVLAAVEDALEILDRTLALHKSDDAVAEVAQPRADYRARSAAAAPNIVGGSSDTAAAWSSVGNSARGLLLQVALSGAVPLERAQTALQIGADAIEMESKVTTLGLSFAAFAHDLSPAAEWYDCYRATYEELAAAHASLSKLLALKTEADIILLRCAPPLHLNLGGPGWLSLQASRGDAERHGQAALSSLLSASAYMDYALEGVLDWGSAASDGQEAQELMRRALADAAEARDAGNKLHHAAGRGFYHAWKVFKGSPPADRAATS